MDSYRGIRVEQDWSGAHRHCDLDSLGQADHEDEIDHEPPPAGIAQDERRMQVRAYNYWTSLLGHRAFPRIQDLDPNDRPDFVDHAVVLDFSRDIDNPAVSLLGAKLAEECGADKPIRTLDDVPGCSLLSRITDHYLPIMANQAPIGFEAEFINQRGKAIVYRGILLPFSSDDVHIQHIMGVINWKELAGPTMTAQLMRELNADVHAGQFHSDQASGQVLDAWADGPATAGSVDPEAEMPTECPLTEWLGSARALAQAAQAAEEGSRTALFAAIGHAWDFALAADADPQLFARIMAAAGLTGQAPLPTVSLVKLMFGAGYDKARLTQFAGALDHARRHRLGRGELATCLGAAPGGLRTVSRDERRLVRAKRGAAKPGL